MRHENNTPEAQVQVQTQTSSVCDQAPPYTSHAPAPRLKVYVWYKDGVFTGYRDGGYLIVTAESVEQARELARPIVWQNYAVRHSCKVIDGKLVSWRDDPKDIEKVMADSSWLDSEPEVHEQPVVIAIQGSD
jgi:hypothetical protein